MGEALDVDRALVQPRCDELFRSTEARLHSSRTPSDKGYLTTLSSLTTTSESHLAGQLYLYLVSQPDYSTPPARQTLIRCMREVCAKTSHLFLGSPSLQKLWLR